MKQWILSLVIITVMGITGQSMDSIYRLPASVDDCPHEETVSLYQNIKSMLSKYSDATRSLVTNASSSISSFNMRSFMTSSYADGDMYSSPFFTNMNDTALYSYHSKVLALQDHNSQRLANAWSPQFDQYGSMTNGHYGFGANTGQAIRYMYANPTAENPYVATASYYGNTTLPSTALVEAPTATPNLSSIDYYGPQ